MAAKSIWGFENLFPTMPHSVAMFSEVYLGFWEPFPNHAIFMSLDQRSLFGVLRTFSQPISHFVNIGRKSIWGFENLFPTLPTIRRLHSEVYLGFWEPFPNQLLIVSTNGRSLFGVLRTFSQRGRVMAKNISEVYLGFWEPFPNPAIQACTISGSLFGVLRTFSQPYGLDVMLT